MNEGDVCFIDCATIHTILRDKRYFLDFALTNGNVSTIMLPNGTRFHINDALHSNKSIRNLLNFKDIHRNGSY